MKSRKNLAKEKGKKSLQSTAQRTRHKGRTWTTNVSTIKMPSSTSHDGMNATCHQKIQKVSLLLVPLRFIKILMKVMSVANVWELMKKMSGWEMVQNGQSVCVACWQNRNRWSWRRKDMFKL